MKLRLTAALAILVLLSGCANSKLKKEAFNKPKTLAVVSIMGNVTGLATTDAQDKLLLSNVVEVTFKELNKSRHIKLVAPSSVLSSKPYKAIKDEGAKMTLDIAPGYKRFEPKKETGNLKEMARALKLDGFVVITASYGTTKSGMTVSGLGGLPLPLTAGNTKATASYMVYAYDAKGEVFWQDLVHVESEEGVTTVMGVGNTQALQPKLIDLTQAACRQTVARLDKNLSGK